MITVSEAYSLIASHERNFGTQKVPFQKALNRILAEDVFANRDFPPFDRVMMDGIAINGDSFANLKRHFFIENESAAGTSIQSLSNKEHCIEVMTGAVLPGGTNVVIPYEECTIEDGVATIVVDKIKPFQNIHRQGSDEKQGAILLPKNTLITATHISILATVGLHEVEVYQLPTIVICSTGDELVGVEQTPLPHQIRQSNVYFMAADLEGENICASIHHLPDNKEQIKENLLSILQSNDVVLLSGAVSKGKKDYLPQTLTEIGFETVFHGVSQRPGKPFLFARMNNKFVFCFPGNPVSTFVCYHLFFKHWLHLNLHQSPKTITAKLNEEVAVPATLALHILVKLFYRDGECFAQPLKASTSGDVISLIHVDGIVSFTSKDKTIHQHEVVTVVVCG
ncbi:MAG: molybdopterin molybdotransferase MoeA [Bacteroidota bacterium]|nr:molybdopterin molybdotransferase MoeA [Bacteroidota bacterium]